METLIQSGNGPLSETEARQAGASGETLRRFLGPEQPARQTKILRVCVEDPEGQRTELLLPSLSLSLLSRILNELGSGKSVVVLTTDAEVTTQQAADLLKVSRPYVVKLLQDGKIPFRTVGPRRRVLLEHLLRYKEREEAERHHGLDELAAEAQKLCMY
jgi:excisionase family DNA binding protein